MALLEKHASAPLIVLAVVISGVAAPFLFMQETTRDALQALCGLAMVLCGIVILLRVPAPLRDTTARRQAAAGVSPILLGCSLIASQRGVRVGLLAGGLLVVAFIMSRRVERWFAA